jgi:hypothetical protein
MSIFDEIEAHVKRGRLIMFDPSDEIRAHRVSASERRTVYVTPAIHAFLKSDAHLAAESDADIADIALGERFDVALEENHVYCRMARLFPASDEVWEIRIYDTKPNIRFFGRFADRDIFVVLIGPIHRIGRTLAWNRLKRDCVSAWNTLFTYPAIHNGDDIDVYLSNVDSI